MEKLATIQMIDVWIPTKDKKWLVLPRYTQLSLEVQILLDRLNLELPAQPPPRIKNPAIPVALSLPVEAPLFR